MRSLDLDKIAGRIEKALNAIKGGDLAKAGTISARFRVNRLTLCSHLLREIADGLHTRIDRCDRIARETGRTYNRCRERHLDVAPASMYEDLLPDDDREVLPRRSRDPFLEPQVDAYNGAVEHRVDARPTATEQPDPASYDSEPPFAPPPGAWPSSSSLFRPPLEQVDEGFAVPRDQVDREPIAPQLEMAGEIEDEDEDEEPDEESPDPSWF